MKEEINISQIGKQIAELVEENNKLTRIKNLIPEITKDLQEATEKLRQIAQKLDPVILIRDQRRNTAMRDKIEELYTKMQSGTYISPKLIRTTYPELLDKHIYYIMAALSKMPHVLRSSNRELYHHAN